MIIGHDQDKEVFEELLKHSINDLKSDSEKRVQYYLGRGGTNLEKDVFQFLNQRAIHTKFNGKIELVSGQKFPDIVAYINEQNALGIEVKTTTKNQWLSTGNSIFEGSRIEEVTSIYLLFGKLYSPIEFMCRKYEDCLRTVAITQSPRYIIDMNTTPADSIFSKIGVSYEDLRKMNNPFIPIKNFFRDNLKIGEDLWWIDGEDTTKDFKIQHWSNLSETEKLNYRLYALAYFPSLLGKNSKKYHALSSWLVAKFGVVNHALRDTFSAGGIGYIDGLPFPKIFLHLLENIDEIIVLVKAIPAEDKLFYWGKESMTSSEHESISTWKTLCLESALGSLDKPQFIHLKKLLTR